MGLLQGGGLSQTKLLRLGGGSSGVQSWLCHGLCSLRQGLALPWACLPLDQQRSNWVAELLNSEEVPQDQ